MDLQADEKLARESAARRVAEMLKFPENLDKLDQLRQRTAGKKNTVDTRLKATVQSQLNDVNDGVATLASSLQTIDQIEDKLGSVGTRFESCSSLSQHTEQVRKLSQHRDELRTTLEQIDSIFSVPEAVASLEREIVDEQTNVLETHNKLSKLEGCRDTLLAMMDKERNSHGRAAIEKYFESVDVLSQRFIQRMFVDLTDPVELVQKKGGGPRLVSWLRIIAREEAIDKQFTNKRERTTSTSSAGRTNSGTSASLRQRSNSLDAKLYSTYRPKLLRDKFMEKFKDGIGLKFDSILFAQSGNVVTMGVFLRAFNSFYFKDLKVAKNMLQDRFPSDIKILDLYLDEYHQRLLQAVDNLVGNDSMDPSEIMKVLEWVPKYRKQMKEDLGIDVTARFKEQLLNSRSGGEAALRKQYLAMLTDKQEGWGTNLIATEVAPWMEPPQDPKDPNFTPPFEPNTTREGLYYTDTPKILFQMIDSQVDVAFTPDNHMNFVMSLIELCMKTLLKFLQSYSQNVDRCHDMYYGPAATERPLCLDLYMMATANNTLIITDDYIPQLTAKVNTRTPAELKGYDLVNKHLKKAKEMCGKIQADACNLLVDIVMDDLRQWTEQLLTPKWFRNKTAIETIVATLNDYSEDFRDHLNPKLLSAVIQGCWRNILVDYVKGILEKRFVCKSKEDRSQFINRLKNEVMSTQELIEKLCIPKDGEEIEDNAPRLCSVITSISHVLLSGSLSMVYAEWQQLQQSFTDITLNHFEGLLDFREDLSLKEVRKLISDQIVKKMSGDKQSRRRRQEDPNDLSAFFKYVKVYSSHDYFGKSDKK